MHLGGYFRAPTTTLYQFFITAYDRSQCTGSMVWGSTAYARVMVSLVDESEAHPHLGRFPDQTGIVSLDMESPGGSVWGGASNGGVGFDRGTTKVMPWHRFEEPSVPPPPVLK